MRLTTAKKCNTTLRRRWITGRAVPKCYQPAMSGAHAAMGAAAGSGCSRTEPLGVAGRPRRWMRGDSTARGDSTGTALLPVGHAIVRGPRPVAQLFQALGRKVHRLGEINSVHAGGRQYLLRQLLGAIACKGGEEGE